MCNETVLGVVDQQRRMHVYFILMGLDASRHPETRNACSRPGVCAALTHAEPPLPSPDKAHIPPDLVVKGYHHSAKASGGEDLEVEHPVVYR